MPARLAATADCVTPSDSAAWENGSALHDRAERGELTCIHRLRRCADGRLFAVGASGVGDHGAHALRGAPASSPSLAMRSTASSSTSSHSGEIGERRARIWARLVRPDTGDEEIELLTQRLTPGPQCLRGPDCLRAICPGHRRHRVPGHRAVLHHPVPAAVGRRPDLALVQEASPALAPGRSTAARAPSQATRWNPILPSTTFTAGLSRGQVRRKLGPFSVVDWGYEVDPVDWGTPNQPHNPNQPRNPARQPDKRDKLSAWTPLRA